MAKLVSYLVWDQGAAGSSPVIPTNLSINMAYIILKHTEVSGQKKVIIVNDSEGEPIEYKTLEQAQKIAELFQNNTTHGSSYEVKQINDAPSTRTL